MCSKLPPCKASKGVSAPSAALLGQQATPSETNPLLPDPKKAKSGGPPQRDNGHPALAG